MSDLFHRSQPASQSQYRDNTAKCAVMAGVATIPSLDRCSCCGKRRTVATGVYSKSGKFTCGMCRPKSARIAETTKPASQGGNPRLASKSQEQF